MNQEGRSESRQPIPGYRLVERVGTGATSAVYRAVQTSLGREVALKVVRCDQTERELRLRRMAKEARLLAQLDHPHIVRSIDFGAVGDRAYFAMEFVEGRSARQLLEEKGRVAAKDVLFLAECVASALEEASAHGVVHRDVKPGNILLGRDGSVKLSDFGLARADLGRTLTRDGATIGTPQYMSPEQVRNARAVDLRSDLYSLGATMYHLLTGRPPFGGESVAEVLHEVLYGRPVPPEELVPEIPESLSRVLAKLMARNPQRRYQDVGSLLDDLQVVRQQLAKVALDESKDVGLSWVEAAESGGSPRRYLPMVLGAAALVLVGVGLGALLLRGDREGPAPDPEAQARVERELVAQLERRLDEGEAGPLEILRRLRELERKETLGARTALERGDLERRLEERIRVAFDEAAAEAVEVTRAESFARGDVLGAVPSVRDAFARGVQRRLGRTEDLASAIFSDLDLERRRSVASAGAVQRIEGSVSRLRGVLADRRTALEAERLERLSAEDGPLLRGRIAECRRYVEGTPEVLRDGLIASEREWFRSDGIDLRSVSDEVLWAGLPEELTDTSTLVERLQREVDDAVADYQRRLVEAAEEAGRELDASLDSARSAESSAALPTTPEWQARWAAARAAVLPADCQEELPSLPGDADRLDWRAAWSKLESRWEREGPRAMAERAERLTILLEEGSAEEPGLLALFAAHRFPEARARVEGFLGLEPAVRTAWTKALTEVEQRLATVDASFAAAAGTAVSFRTTDGVRHRGNLRVDRVRGFQVDEGERWFQAVDLSFPELLDPRFGALEDDARALVLYAFGAKPEEVESSLPSSAESDSPVQRALRSALESSRFADAQTRARLVAEFEARLAELRTAVAEQRTQEARELVQAIGRLRIRRIAELQPARAELEQLERTLEEIERLGAARRALSAAFPHARTEVREDGSVVVEYDFETEAQGEDWVRNEIPVVNGALHIAAGQLSASLESWIWGPSLPLAADPTRPFRLTLELACPFEQPDPQALGFTFQGLSALFFRPRSPYDMHFAAQLALYAGPLDSSRALRHLFDPSTGQTSPAEGRVVQMGLEHGTVHQVVLTYDPSSGQVSLGLDGRMAQSLVQKSLEEEGRFELRTIDPVDLRSLRFEGGWRAR